MPDTFDGNVEGAAEAAKAAAQDNGERT